MIKTDDHDHTIGREKRIPWKERFAKGKRFGMLEVLETHDYKKYGGKVLFRCDCGMVKRINPKNILTNNLQRSCGCATKKSRMGYNRLFFVPTKSKFDIY